MDPRSSVALIPLAERRYSIILHLSFIRGATIWARATLCGPVAALTDEQSLISAFFCPHLLVFMFLADTCFGFV